MTFKIKQLQNKQLDPDKMLYLMSDQDLHCVELFHQIWDQQTANCVVKLKKKKTGAFKQCIL